ncbi:hypothetical protein [Pareuzebyella sediminis]|uniref:hypothetical protein n=1 Tax=Pareuzebyella sediminis TaxID=2607998 RepID=UPI0011EBB164|nr:hypothetical protein [Pareuzebyella sediminis]
MSIKSTIFILPFLVSTICFSQEDSNTKDSAEEKNQELIEKFSEKVVATAKQKLEEEYEVDEKKLLGTFHLKETKVEVDLKITEEGFLKRDSTLKYDKKFNIESIKIDIREGVVFDIRIKGKLQDTSVLFTNHAPINMSSLIRHEVYLTYLRQGVKESFLSKYRIRLKDFLEYDYENGQNYVIDNELIELNSSDKKEAKVYGKGSLKSLIDFRIYTDFLGIINESANGIVSFEGNSTFFLNPFSIKGYNYIFKKLNSSVRYSRFDDNDQNIALPIVDTLDLIQKSFLNVSGEIDLFETRFSKRYPYKLHLKTKFGLDIAKTKEDGLDDSSNTTTLGIGFGAGIQVQRYSNFGLNSTFYFNRYENNGLFDSGTVNFNTIELNTEVYFYDSKDKNDNDAFFLRLAYEQGIKNLSSSSNFFNIQLGYKAQLNFNPKKD